MTTPLPPNETARLAAVRECGLLDTPPDPNFDDFVRVAACVCDVPIALVCLVEQDRQWFKARVGLDATETPRAVSFCAHAILEPRSAFIVPDATDDPRFAENALVTGAPQIRFYAGVPLVTAEGHALGTLCVIDRKPRQLSPAQLASLQALARQVEMLIGMRRIIAARRQSEESLHRKRQAMDAAMDGIAVLNSAGEYLYLNRAHATIFGYTDPAELVGKTWRELYAADEIDRIEREVFPLFLTDGKWEGEAVAQRCDGEKFHQGFSLTALDDGGLICVCRDISERKRQEDQIKASLLEKEVLLAEVHHRVKNNLQIVSSLLHLQARQCGEPALPDGFASTQARIRVMAAVHEQMYQTGNFSSIDFAEYVGGLARIITQAHASRRVRLRCVSEKEPVMVDLNTAVPLSLIINEGILNAAQYACGGEAEGELKIELRAGAKYHELCVSDDGPGFPADVDPEHATTLGLRLMRTLARQICAELKIESSAAGTSIHIVWPAGPRRENEVAAA